MADPFGEWGPVHPALGASHKLSSDIYHGLFDWFFYSDTFKHWTREDCEWQLHCIGGPGSGKTTLSALAIQHLKKQFQDVPIASIFIKEDVLSHENAFFEDFLGTIYIQLEEVDASSPDESHDWFSKYDSARDDRRRITHRIDLIQKALYSRKKAYQRAFLIVDGLDRCNSALHYLLERELKTLQKQGFNILVTSRLEIFQKPENARCDVSENHNGEPSAPLDLWLECKKPQCEYDGSVLCFPCRMEGKPCQICMKDDTLYEPYEQVSFQVGTIPVAIMEQFIAWDLEREHGDLCLESPVVEKPPLSDLGEQILEDKTGNVARGLIQRVLDRVYGNISMAKIRLDNIHAADSLTALDIPTYRIPANLISVFDAGIERIEAQPPAQRNLGLKAIAAASHAPEGIPLKDVERWLRSADTDEISETRSFEDVLEAARGFIFLFKTGDQKIRLFHTSLQYYVSDRYNESLYWADSQLKTEKMFRSLTMQIKEGDQLGRGSLNTLDEEPEVHEDKPPRPMFDRAKFRLEPLKMLGDTKDKLPDPSGPRLSRTQTGLFPSTGRKSRPMPGFIETEEQKKERQEHKVMRRFS